MIKRSKEGEAESFDDEEQRSREEESPESSLSFSSVTPQGRQDSCLVSVNVNSKLLSVHMRMFGNRLGEQV